MWKYQCKKHLAMILAGAVVGAILFTYMGYPQEAIRQAAEMMNMPEVTKISYLPYVLGAITGAGAVNGLLLITYVTQHFNISFFITYMIIFIGFSIIAPFGMLALLPAIAVCLYGWLTIPNRASRSNLKKNTVSSVAEVERVYRLHHTYLSEYEDLAKKVWEYTLKMNLAYVIGVLIVFWLILLVDDLFMLFIVFIVYAILFMMMTRRKAIALQPIISLLYEECNPQACASAIFALARKSKKRKNFPLAQYLAQSMIYLNDPQLAADVMVTCERNKSAMIFPYYSIMSYVYYQLGDKGMVNHQLDECEKNSARMTNGPMGMLRMQCLASIQTKIALMDKDFEKAKAYYEDILLPQRNAYEVQKVDAHYYLGLISFVDKDFDGAVTHFQYVSSHGNGVYYVEKAQAFLKKLEVAMPQEA